MTRKDLLVNKLVKLCKENNAIRIELHSGEHQPDQNQNLRKRLCSNPTLINELLEEIG
ncbi:MAG: hypothetical protein ACREOZ_02165 [Gloeomargaritales cyanobacterium]